VCRICGGLGTYDCDGREVGQPVQGVRELLDLNTRNANGLHDLKLVGQACRFRYDFSFLCFGFVLLASGCCIFRGLFLRSRCVEFRLYFFISFEISPEKLDLPDDLVRRRLACSIS
jgi:hypothetical protein